jgi:UbiD family decarboxylase
LPLDPDDEQEVMYAVATRTQGNEDVDIVKNSKGNTLDPSQTDDMMTPKANGARRSGRAALNLVGSK